MQIPAGTPDKPVLRTLCINIIINTGGGAGGALDLLLSFDLGPADETWSGYGVAVRSAPNSVEGAAAMRLSVTVTDGVRTALVSGTGTIFC